MADPFVAEIRMFPFSFAPKAWAFCDGQILPVSQSTALFSLLGTTYGGNGTSNFALPNMQGNSPMHPGQGPGLTLHDLGETGGSETVTLLQSEIPSHSHPVVGHTADPGDNTVPAPTVVLAKSNNGQLYQTTATGLTQMALQTLSPVGGNLPHKNLMPYLTLNFCIALQGIFPQRS